MSCGIFLYRNPIPLEFIEAIVQGASSGGIHVILDYLWGRPTEAVIAAIARLGVTQGAPSVRLIDLGQITGPTITLPAFVLRSSGLLISGVAVALTPIERLREAIPRLIAEAASGTLRIETESVPLAQIEAAWQHQTPNGSRLVVLP